MLGFLSGAAVVLALPASAAAVGELSCDACFGSAAGCTNLPGNPLQDTHAVAVSPNGPVYVTGADLSNPTGPVGFLSHFSAAADGRPSFDACLSDTGGACTDIPGTGTPLGNPVSVAVSPNAGSVYVLGGGSNVLSHLFADRVTGKLKWDQCVSNDGSGGTCIKGPQSGSGDPFAQVTGLAVNADASAPNSSVYFASFNGTLSHLFADPDSGQLNWDGCVSDDGSGATCADLNAPALMSPVGIAVNPNGTAVYVASGGGVSQFRAVPSGGGGITSWVGCVNDDGSNGCKQGPTGGSPLSGAGAVAVSPDGRSVYVASRGGGSIAHFFRVTSGGGGGGGGNQPRTLTAKIDNQLISVVTSLRSGCVASSGSLSATLSSSAIPGSNATKLRSAGAAFSIDRGVRHVHHRTVRRNGKKVVVKTVTYSPNDKVGGLPANVSLKLAGLSSGSHAFKVKVFYHETVKRHGHRHTVTVSKTLSLTLKVC